MGLTGIDAGKLNLSDNRGRCGFNVAARSEVSFSEAASRMYLDAELGLLNLGWKSRYSYYMTDFYPNDTGKDRIDVDQKYETDAYYLHLPLHVGYRWAFSRACALYVDAGPYFSLGLFGKSKMTDYINHTKEKGDTFDGIRRFDWGLGARIGVELADHYRLGVGYDSGLRKLSAYNLGHNYNFSVSIGYMF